jgi:hypothetical protein
VRAAAFVERAIPAGDQELWAVSGNQVAKATDSGVGAESSNYAHLVQYAWIREARRGAFG